MSDLLDVICTTPYSIFNKEQEAVVSRTSWLGTEWKDKCHWRLANKADMFVNVTTLKDYVSDKSDNGRD